MTATPSPRLVLASGSTHRLRLLRDAGYDPIVVVPDIDERELPWDREAADEYVLDLAEAKLSVVLERLRCDGSESEFVVLAADQVVVDPAGALCHQQSDVASATAQLLRLSGTTHDLVNGVVVADPAGRVERLVDRHRITMTAFGPAEARSYVETYLPFECAGSYRLEDDAGLVGSVEGDEPSGVIDLPVRKVEAMLRRAGVVSSR